MGHLYAALKNIIDNLRSRLSRRAERRACRECGGRGWFNSIRGKFACPYCSGDDSDGAGA